MAIMPFKMENEHILPSEIQYNTSDDRRGLKEIFDRHDNATNKYDRCRLRKRLRKLGILRYVMVYLTMWMYY